MKKILSLTMALSVFAHSFAFAANNSQLERDFKELARDQQVQEAIQDLRKLEIKDLSLAQLEKGLSEMRLRIAGLKLDLKDMQKDHDGRIAVKLRNYGTMSLAGLTVLAFTAAFLVADDMEGALLGSGALWVLLPATVLFGAASSGYVYLTSEELRDLKKNVEILEAKISAIEEKVIRRKLALKK